MNKELSISNLLPVLSSSKIAELKEDMFGKTFVGIDFGTSTTVVSVATLSKESQPLKVGTIELNQRLDDGGIFSSYKVPTVIAWFNGNVLIGEGAKKLKHKLRVGKNLWHSFKMELGEDVGCKYPNSELGKNHPLVTIFNPVDATSLFFKYLKTQIEKFVKVNNLPEKIEYAVSIPASFEANQRADLIRSIESNGILLNKQSLIDEPNAAFLSYVLSSKSNNSPLTIPQDYYPNVLVFDFGAGTCDISILEVGEDNNGVYSKNIAISRFEKLGGNDIDKLISIDVLLPQLLKNSKFKIEDFRTRELNDLIIPKLMPSAERLKIQMCEYVSLKTSSKKLDDILKESHSISIGTVLSIETSKGVLKLDEPSLSLDQFEKIISVFCQEQKLTAVKRIEKECEFISVFTPILSALKKAKLNKSEVDYLLFIGGSSKNPFIQNAISNYFPDTKKLVPNDLQAHVSNGAAIHSLIFNGFGKNIIQPITSEPIMLIAKDGYQEKVESIISAGTFIPSEPMSIDNLSPQREGQEAIELPICVGNKNKILYNIKMFNPDGGGFKLQDIIKLEFEINSDKLLLIKASAAGKEVTVEPISPFSNKDLTGEERIRYKAERDFNLECQINGGEPTLEALKKLHKAYEAIGLHFKAGETLEQIEEMFPGKGNLNNIGLHYSNAGKKDKAISFYEKAMAQAPSSTTAFNLAMQFKSSNREKYLEYLNKAKALDENHVVVTYSLGEELIEKGDEVVGKQMVQESFDKWNKKFELNQLAHWEYSWFSSCAKSLGKNDFAKHIEDSAPAEDFEKLYNSNNLTQLKRETSLQKLK